MNGNGTYIWANKRKYEGTWVNNQKHGKGVYTLENGEKYNVEWKFDELVRYKK
jgi:hypothetical protein